MKDEVAIQKEPVAVAQEIKRPKPNINKWFVGAIYRFVQAWDRTVSHLDDSPTKRCHLQLSRLSKGMLKAVRVYVIEIEQEQNGK